jgi:hypothetical protein
MYQPPGQPVPWMASRRLFHAFGGEMTGCGAARRRIVQHHALEDAAIDGAGLEAHDEGHVLPSSVVVIATSAGSAVVLGIDLKAPPAVEI